MFKNYFYMCLCISIYVSIFVYMFICFYNFLYIFIYVGQRSLRSLAAHSPRRYRKSSQARSYVALGRYWAQIGRMYIRIYKYIKIYKNIQKYIKIYKNIYKKSMQKCKKISKSQKNILILKRFLAYF